MSLTALMYKDDKNVRTNLRGIKLWSRCGGAAEVRVAPLEIEVCQPSRKGDIEIDLHHVRDVPVHTVLCYWCYNDRN